MRIVSMRKSQRTSQHGTQNVKTHSRTTRKKTKKMSNTDPQKNLNNDSLQSNIKRLTQTYQ
jgi:hypothetical protein